MERDGDTEGAAARCLWQEGKEGGRVGGVSRQFPLCSYCSDCLPPTAFTEVPN